MFLTSFSDVVCLKLLGSEFHTLGPVYLITYIPFTFTFTYDSGHIVSAFLTGSSTIRSPLLEF